MKKLQREFVVEVKTSRRDVKAPSRSIWGDTDLKAIARQVEELVPDRPTSSRAEEPAAKKAAGRILYPVLAAEAKDEPASRPKVYDKRSDPKIEWETAVGVAVRLEDNSIKHEAMGASFGASDAEEPPAPVDESIPATGDSQLRPELVENDESIAVSKEELSALVDEHRQLKWQLTQRLISDNARLKAEIARINYDSGVYA